MGTASLSGVITAQSVGTEEPPCQVIQQQDTEDTAPCTSGAENALNGILRMLGVTIPAQKESETYSSSITVKPKNIYTSLNISITHGGLHAPTYNSGLQEARLDVSTGDFRLEDNSYYIDIRSASGLAETDNISSVAWIGTPIDDDLNAISPRPAISVTQDDLLKANKPANGVIKVRFIETTATYKINIEPREGVENGFYKSNLVISAEGCNDKPFFYEIKSPPCYEQNKLKDLLDDIPKIAVEHTPPSPKGGEEYECEYCLCTLRLQSETVDGMCSGSTEGTEDTEDTGGCKSGPGHKDC